MNAVNTRSGYDDIGGWVAVKRSTAASALLATALIAAVVLAAVTAPTPQTGGLGSGDTGVWVLNGTAPAVGRVNTQIDELDTTVPSPSADSTIAQSGSSIVLVDNAAGTATRIDPATARPASSLSLPRRTSLVEIMAADVVVASRDGRVWQVPLDSFAAFDAEGSQQLELGAGSAVTVTPAGGLAAVSAATNEVLTVEPGARLSDNARTAVQLPPNAEHLQIVATRNGWAVFDPDSASLISERGTVDLAEALGAAGAGEQTTQAVLQQSAPSSALPTERGDDTVHLATRSALIEVDLASGRTRTLSAGHDGEPVRPVDVGGCLYAAWSDGTSWQRCDDGPTAGRAGVLVGMTANARPVFRTNITEVVLNDAATGQVWAVENENRPVEGWDLPESRNDAPTVQATEPQPATPEPRTTRRPTTPPTTTPPPVNTANNAAGEESRTPTPDTPPPTPTPVSARLNADTATVTLTWDPFAPGDGPMLGYFAQSLGAGRATADAPCTVPPSAGVLAPTGGEVQSVGLWTTAGFGGIANDGTTRRFIVWGYDRSGCSASAVVSVTALAPPGPVTAVQGAMVELGTEVEYQIESVQPSAARYEIQRLQADGGPTGEIVGLATTPATPRLATGGGFGEVYEYRIRACNAVEDGAACGPWTEQAAPEKTLTLAVTGLAYSAETGAWTWAGLPDNGEVTAKVRCGSNSATSGSYKSGVGFCDMEFGVSTDDAWLTLVIGTRQVTYPLAG